MKILGYSLICIAFLMIALAVAFEVMILLDVRERHVSVDATIGIIAAGVAVLIYGAIVYGIGRMVEELTRIHGLLKYSRGPSASEIAQHLRDMRE